MQLSALAEGPYEYEYRHVSGCDRWISLRAELSRSSERLAKIPLDALVMFLGDADDEFFYIQYAGMRGYALRSYLCDGYNAERYDIPMYVVNCDESVDLLSIPETGADVLAEVPLGEDVICRHQTADDGGMVLVRYMDQDGYLSLEDLSFLPQWDYGLIRSATVLMPGQNGKTVVQTVRDDFALAELSAMICKARPGITGQCPVGAQLVLVINDGTTEGRELKFMLPMDGCTTLIGENLAVYEMSQQEGKRFWEISG